MNGILNYIRFNWCFYFIVGLLVLVIPSVLFTFIYHIPTLTIILGNIGKVFALYVVFGFIKYGYLVKNDRFIKLFYWAMTMFIFSIILSNLLYKTAFIIIPWGFDIIENFLLFKAYKVVSDSKIAAFRVLSKLFFLLFVVTLGHLIISMFPIIDVVLILIIAIIILDVLVYCFSLPIFKYLHIEYELKAPNIN